MQRTTSPNDIINKDPIDMEHHGYWASHEYKRHKVAEIEEFVGWDVIDKLCRQGNGARNKALAATAILTGGRISEVISLRKNQFSEEQIGEQVFCKVSQMKIVKQKVDVPFRTFAFPTTDPPYIFLKEYGRLIVKENALLFPFNRTNAYLILREMGHKIKLEIWAHWFRSQRASQLGSEKEFTENELLEWFKTKDRNWAHRYCKMGWKKLAMKQL